MFKVGLSTTGKVIDEKLFCMYSEAGIEMMEVSTGDYSTLAYKAIEKYSAKHGVKLWSFHCPFKPFETLDISSGDENLRKSSVKYTGELIKKAADIGIDKYIVHAGGILKERSEKEVGERIKSVKQSYSELAEIAAAAGGTVVAENLPPICVCTNIAEAEDILSADSRLRMCFDTNHLLPGDPIEFIKHFGEKIITIHVSDYDNINERHWLPGEGVVNFYDIYDALKEVNYKGPWLYEVGFVNRSTLNRERDLTCHDFAKNAVEIAEKKPLSVVPGVKLV